MPSSMTKPRIGNALLHLSTDVEAALDVADFNRWCEAHARDNLELPGFLSVRRFAKKADYEGAGDHPQFLTLYGLQDVSALETPEHAAHNASLPARFAPHLRFERSVYRALASHEGASAGSPSTAILHVWVDVEPASLDDFLEWFPGVTRAQAEAVLRMCAESLDDASDGRIALERLRKPEGWYSLEDLEKDRDR